MKKFLKLFPLIVKNNLIREMEFRSNFILGVIDSILWVGLQIAMIEVYFQFTDQIFGWTKYEMFALAGIVRLVKGLFDALARPNILSFPDVVSKGELDYTLTRPVDSQFMLSFRRHALSEMIALPTGVIMLSYFFIASGFQFSVWNAGVIFLGVLSAFIAYYSVFFTLGSLSIFMTRMTALKELQDVFSQTMRYPTDIFSRGNKVADIFLMPLFIFATLPTKILLSHGDVKLLIIQMVVCLTIFVASRQFWKFTVRRYSSASS